MTKQIMLLKVDARNMDGDEAIKYCTDVKDMVLANFTKEEQQRITLITIPVINENDVTNLTMMATIDMNEV